MRKTLLCLLAMAAYCPAFGQAGITDVHEVAKSTNSLIQTINIGNNLPVDVAAATSSGTLSGYYAIEVFVTASTSTVNCGFEVGVSTNINSVWYGREIVAGTGVYFAVPSPRKLWCLSQNTGGSVRATITQLK